MAKNYVRGLSNSGCVNPSLAPAREMVPPLLPLPSAFAQSDFMLCCGAQNAMFESWGVVDDVGLLLPAYSEPPTTAALATGVEAGAPAPVLALGPAIAGASLITQRALSLPLQEDKDQGVTTIRATLTHRALHTAPSVLLFFAGKRGWLR
jgi:hypothetical protein